MLKAMRWQQIVLALIGLAIVGFTLRITERWTSFAPGSANQLLLLAFGVLLAVVALTGEKFPASRLQQAYQTFSVIVLNTVLFLLIVEMVITLSINLKYQFVFDGQVIANGWDVRPDFPYFQQVAWSDSYWNDYYHAGTEYRPYVMWRHRPKTGEAINIDQDGIRLTPGAQCSADAYTVWMFGGSTMWGEGSPDWLTIPADVQTRLGEQMPDRSVCVVNYGEIAYVSTQEVVTLTLLLRDGKVPDVVIFYDGLNDIFASHQNGKAGLHQNLALIQRQLAQNSIGTAVLNAVLTSNTFAFVSGLVSGTGRTDPYGINDDLEALSKDTVTVYLQNYELVDRLAVAYGFDYHFFWQPTLLLTNKPLNSIEEGILATQNPKWLELNRLAYDQIKQIAGTPQYSQLYYIADVFDQFDGFLWFDQSHIVPEGNAIVAARMLDILSSDS